MKVVHYTRTSDHGEYGLALCFLLEAERCDSGWWWVGDDMSGDIFFVNCVSI